MKFASSIIDGLRRLPRCKYKDYHPSDPGKEIHYHGCTYPRCKASRCHDHQTAAAL